MSRLFSAIAAAALAVLLCAGTAQAEPLVIAHRGASGYLPEHTLAAQAMAVGQGADFIEQDVVLSRDGVPLVLHDLTLDAVTDVALRFPDRARDDGRFYAIDFDLAEIRTLRVRERVDAATGDPMFPKRFPDVPVPFSVATLAESIALVQGLEASTGRPIGIYPEIKRPAWHRAEGQDISRIVLDLLDRPWLRRRRRSAALPAVLRLGGNPAHPPRARLCRPARPADRPEHLAGCRRHRLSGTADDGGPGRARPDGRRHRPHDRTGHRRQGRTTSLAQRARAHGLAVHAYTLRADRLPGWAGDMTVLTTRLVEAGVGGLFTDHPRPDPPGPSGLAR
jgi:glycerophosphoryl diester phosphodiesterase